MPVYFLGEDLLFPDPENADDSGLLAVGGDLSTQRLLLAYRCGIFPWFSKEDPILWFSPDPRLVVFPKEYAPSKSLMKEIKSDKFKVRFDSDFRTVIENCSNVKRKSQTGTWITNEMKKAYIELHEKGYAHSVETYKDGNLVGGLYGVSIGRVFFG